MAPADHSVDSILHRDLQLEGGLAGPRGIILTGERRETQLASASEEEARPEEAPSQAWLHLPAYIGHQKQPVSQHGLGGDIKGDRKGHLRKRQAWV